MADVILFPDAERVLIVHLNSLLTEPVSLTVPNPRPAAFIVVRRVGGPRRDLVTDHPMLTVEAWAGGPTAAKALLERARGEIFAMRGTVVDGVAIYGITETGGPAFLPDPDSTQPRYTCTLQVAMRGAASHSTPDDGGGSS